MFKPITALLAALASSWALAAVDVNQADKGQLEALKGVGPSTAQRILSERERSPFSNWADLILRVPGIGDTRAERLSQEGLRVNGVSLQEAATATPAQAPQGAAATAASKTAASAGGTPASRAAPAR